MKTSLLLPVLGSLVTLQAAMFPAVAESQPQPVLMVIANQDFYYREYSETRSSIEAAGLDVVVASATTKSCLPAPGTGQPESRDGGVTPDLPLADASAHDYSAIVFVGGWGSSMYQYAYNDPNYDGTIDNFYSDESYNGDADGTKAAVNNLINDFVEQDKHVAAICHGVTVLAWARVDGESLVKGKKVIAPSYGAPPTFYMGRWYADNEFSAQEQVIDNGGFANPYSGAYGDPTTAADDVIVDGRIITAENYDSAQLFGRVIATQVFRSQK